MIIDSPRPEDTSAVVGLAQATGFFTAEELRVIGELLDEFFDKPAEGEYLWLVYREAEGAEPLGFACYGPVSMSEDVYDLYWIAVDPRQQARHIGSALLERVEQDLRGRHARQLYIETSDTPLYEPTRAFYLRRGYIEVAHLTDFYRVGDGKLIYRKVFREG